MVDECVIGRDGGEKMEIFVDLSQNFISDQCILSLCQSLSPVTPLLSSDSSSLHISFESNLLGPLAISKLVELVGGVVNEEGVIQSDSIPISFNISNNFPFEIVDKDPSTKNKKKRRKKKKKTSGNKEREEQEEGMIREEEEEEDHEKRKQQKKKKKRETRMVRKRKSEAEKVKKQVDKIRRDALMTSYGDSILITEDQ